MDLSFGFAQRSFVAQMVAFIRSWRRRWRLNAR